MSVNYARFGACVAGALDSYLSGDVPETPAEFVSYLLDLAEQQGVRAGQETDWVRDCPADMSGIHAPDEDGACLNCDQILVERIGGRRQVSDQKPADPAPCPRCTEWDAVPVGNGPKRNAALKAMGRSFAVHTCGLEANR